MKKNRTICLSYGTPSARIRKMKPAEKEMLFNNGMQAKVDFLEAHN
jgi:hypothetical protein